MSENVSMLVDYIRRKLPNLSTPTSDVAYSYACLPLCVIDAVFSIGVRYESTQRTVDEWCKRYRWGKELAGTVEERTMTAFLQILQPYENRWENMANDVFCNRQRTSSRSGIPKAEAVYRFSQVLQRFGVEVFADALKFGLRDDLRHAIKSIPGQGSGLSLNYFLILAGNKDAVKGDRMVRRFVANALGVQNVPSELAEGLVRQASAFLRPEFPELMPSVLDNKIWEYQRDSGKAPMGDCRREILDRTAGRSRRDCEKACNIHGLKLKNPVLRFTPARFSAPTSWSRCNSV